MTFEDIYLIEGILTEEEKRLLYNLAKMWRRYSRDWIMERFVYNLLALGLKEGYKVYVTYPHRRAT
jgi:hypothetical protein